MDLFNRQQTIILHVPTKEAFKDWYRRLNVLNMDILQDLAAPFRRILRKKEIQAIDVFDNKQTPVQVTNYLSKTSAIKKSEIVDFLSYIVADAHNFKFYLDSLSTDESEVWKAAMTQYYISTDEIYQLTGQQWVKQDTHWYDYYRKQNTSDKLAWFDIVEAKGVSTKNHPWNRNIYCNLPAPLFSNLLPVFFPEECNLSGQCLDLLPSNLSLHTFCGESDIMLALPTLAGLCESGQLPLPKTKLTLAAVRKLSGILSMNEFFPEHKVKELAYFRHSLVLNMFAWGTQGVSTKQRPELLLKGLFSTALNVPTMLVNVLLPHLTGFRKKEVNDANSTYLAFSLWDLMGTLPHNKWISVRAIFFRLLRFATHYVPMFTPHILDKMDIMNEKLGHRVYLNRLLNEVSMPFVTALLYAMSAFGFLIVAYADVAAGDASYTSSLAYVRMTNLGAFVWKKKARYTPTVSAQQQGPLFELNGQHLIVRSLAERNPYLAILTEMATPVGGQRFRVTAASFIGNCRNSQELEERISLFKQYICPEPSPEWEEFFNDLVQHSHSITKKPDKEYVIYHIDPKDKELQRIVSTDPFIRQHSLRAEGYLWLVKTSELKAVQKRLKECGYLF